MENNEIYIKEFSYKKIIPEYLAVLFLGKALEKIYSWCPLTPKWKKRIE